LAIEFAGVYIFVFGKLLSLRKNYEENISTQQHQAKKNPWFSPAHENQGRQDYYQ
jgi:hypothetical protein